MDESGNTVIPAPPLVESGVSPAATSDRRPPSSFQDVDDGPRRSPREWLTLLSQGLRNSGLLLSLIIVTIYFSLAAPHFWSLTNLWVTLRSVAPIGIISVGMTMVIITGEIDLGVGSLGGFAGCLVAYLAIDAGWPVLPAVIATLLVGIAAGVVAGLARVLFEVPTFVTTLAYLVAFQGAGFLITNGFPISPFPDNYSELGAGTLKVSMPVVSGLNGAPISGLVMIAIFIVGYVMTRYSQFGRWVFAVGGNAEAARLVGINVGMIKTTVMAITGLLSAFAGIVVSSLLSSGDPNVGTSWVFDVVAAVIIGGTSLTGGRGSMLRTFLGVIFIGTLSDGMVLMNVSQYTQQVVRGAIILFAVLLSLLQARRRRRRSPATR